MRDGNACGLMTRSGTTPSAVNGISHWSYIMPHVPFWAVNDANLSPISGMRILRSLILTHLHPSAMLNTNLSSK
ncbi:ORF039L [giant sea perch iridovirus - K1]|uniref:ORF039L n=1 Tax=Giant seaperch iridovirus TaxID=176655 RepID=A0A140GBE9_GSIV|nr:ORF039L [giant sea perch iridovirus - K1]